MHQLKSMELLVQDLTSRDGLLYVAAGHEGLRILRPVASDDPRPTPDRRVAYAPMIVRETSRQAIATPVHMPPTPTPTSTPTDTPTASPTPPRGFLGFDGFVWEGSASGPGLPDVELRLWIENNREPSATTDASGFYTTSLIEFQGEVTGWRLVPRRGGYHFDPPDATGQHRGGGIPNQRVERVSFVALVGTPTPTPTQ